MRSITHIFLSLDGPNSNNHSDKRHEWNLMMREGLADLTKTLSQSPPTFDNLPGKKPIIIAVLDSGIYHNHPKLRDMVIGWASVVPGETIDNAYDDFVNHGTFCAGIIWRYAYAL